MSVVFEDVGLPLVKFTVEVDAVLTGWVTAIFGPSIPILYVTHSPDEVVALCDEILFLERGCLVRQRHPNEFSVTRETPMYRLKNDYRVRAITGPAVRVRPSTISLLNMS